MTHTEKQTTTDRSPCTCAPDETPCPACVAAGECYSRSLPGRRAAQRDRRLFHEQRLGETAAQIRRLDRFLALYTPEEFTDLWRQRAALRRDRLRRLRTLRALDTHVHSCA